MSEPRNPADDQINERLDEVVTMLADQAKRTSQQDIVLEAVREQTTITNGRVNRHDVELAHARQDIDEVKGEQANTNEAIWGANDGKGGLKDGTGLMGLARTTQRDVRIIGAAVGALLLAALPYIFGALT